LPIYYRRHYASGRIRRDLGWKTRSYSEGIRETLALESSPSVVDPETTEA
jgi:hypothetical protein